MTRQLSHAPLKTERHVAGADRETDLAGACRGGHEGFNLVHEYRDHIAGPVTRIAWSRPICAQSGGWLAFTTGCRESGPVGGRESG